jgi:hypothetical protein
MSLINDALKKAQKMRLQDQAAPAPSNGNSGPVAKRARPMSTQLLVGLLAGAAVLVGGSVLATVFWLRNPAPAPAPKPVASLAAVSISPSPTPAAPPTGNAAPPSATMLTPTASAPPGVGAPPTAVGGTAPLAPLPEAQPSIALPIASAPPPESPPAPADLTSPPVSSVRPSSGASPVIRPAPVAKPDARIQTYIEALRVTGIRASGTDSKVLMNDRVFRVNDIVERSLGLRLTGVAADRLSFTDENGMVYTRNF